LQIAEIETWHDDDAKRLRRRGPCGGGAGEERHGEQRREGREPAAQEAPREARKPGPACAGVRCVIALDALALRGAVLTRGEEVRAAVLAAGVSALLAVFGPPAGDAAAHLYRTLLVEEGVLIWDNLWYGGHYPLASYSVLYYAVAALLGNVLLAACAAVVSAALFARVCMREFGVAATRAASPAFAVLACAPLFTGTYPYAVGVATALAALAALQAGWTWLALLASLLTVGFSPLAFAFLCLALAAVALARRPARRQLAVVGGGLAVAAALELVLLLAFPAEGRYQFRANELGLALLCASVGAAIAARERRGRVLVALFVLWGLACVLAFFIPSPLGSTITRLRTFALPLVLLACALSGFRPRWLALPAVVAAAFYSVSPFIIVATQIGDSRAASEGYWTPALAFLEQQGAADHRVDVIPTFDNWEAYYVPRAGHALARGWYRQLDLARNPELYRDDLAPADYRRWLRSLGVRFVLLPDVPLDRLGAEPQAALVLSGRSGLREVWRAPGWRIFELPGATPILTGPGDARLSFLGHDRIAGDVGAPGEYHLRVRYTPYWDVRAGAVCIERARGGMTRLSAARPGAFELGVSLRPSRGDCGRRVEAPSG
jgi:hypothetical protein